MRTTGNGRRKVLVCAECPGETEDREGIQLIGKAGQRLRRTLDKIGIDLDEDCWKTNAVICYPGHRNPTAAEIDHCRPNLIRDVKDLEPEIIIPMGGPAVHSLMGWLWGDKAPGPVTRWVGWRVPSQRLNAWITPTYHPSYVERESDNKPLALWFERHLRAAFAIQGRPWDVVPDYASQIEVIYDADIAARAVRQMIARGGPVAFDYETNCLKPDKGGARIVCCSVCWRGLRTVTFPWYGAAIDAMRELVTSPLPKIAANMKFEERWSIAKLGTPVVNWAWCTMQAAHVLDNRHEITGLKFQAFVQFGIDLYNRHIEQFLEATDEEGFNRIAEIDLGQLLKYCGLDSLMEYKLAEKQREAFQI